MQLFNDFAHILGEWPSGSPEWLAARGCGASTIPDLAAFERWTRDPQGVKPPKRTPWKKYAAILEKNEEEKYIMDRGNAMEATNLKWCIEDLPGLELFKFSLCHPDHEWYTINLDGVQWGMVDGVKTPIALAEFKDHSSYAKRDYVNGPTDLLRDQMHWQGMGTNIRTLYGCVSIDGQQPDIYPIEWEQDRADFLIEVGYKFWHDHIIPRVPPVPDYSEECASAILDSWIEQEVEPKDGVMSEEAIVWVVKCDLAKKDRIAAENREKVAKAVLSAMLDGNKRLVSPGGKKATAVWTSWVDWSAICQSEAEKVGEFRTKLDEKGFELKHPKIVAAHRKTRPSHILVTNPGPRKAKKKRVKKNPKTTTEAKP